MKKFSMLLLLLICSFPCFSMPAFAQAGARDAEAVLNRCGKPLKGDETLYTNDLSTRTLEYERGTLIFDRVGNDGWKFASGSHKKEQNLTAAQMAVFFPCLPLALADSASPEPLKKVTSVQRLEVSAKNSYKQLVLYTLLGLVVLGLIFFLLSNRKHADEDVN